MKKANIWHYISLKVLPPTFLKEGLVAFSFNIFGVLAGFALASYLNVFQLSSWALALYPPMLTARGVVNGLLSGRLGTALHLGTIQPRLRGNTQNFYMLFRSVLVVTLETSILLGFISIIFGSLFWGIGIPDWINILSIIMATMAIGVTTSLITTEVAFLSFKKAWDPDVIVYPVMSTIGDVFITLCYVLILNMFFLFGFPGRVAVALLGLTLIIIALSVLPKCIHNKQFVETIKETLAPLLFIATIVNITGTVLKGISEFIGNRKEIYTVYPALIDTVGDVGSVVGSTATTKLVLGFLKPSFSEIRKHMPRIVSTGVASLIMFMIYGFVSLMGHGVISSEIILKLIALLIITNIIAVSIIAVVSFGIATATFKRGWDPDNFVIPIESALADSITTVALVVALLLVG